MSGPAFPIIIDSSIFHSGLSKRELFAAMAMQGLIIVPPSCPAKWEDLPVAAVRYADSLIAALEK